jgi:hypothetical protein
LHMIFMCHKVLHGDDSFTSSPKESCCRL